MKSNNKSRNGVTKTPPGAVKGKSDKKGKGDDTKDKTSDTVGSQNKTKIKNGALKLGTKTVKEVSTASRRNTKSGDFDEDSHSSGSQLKQAMESERQERETIVLWKRPITTLHYFLVELYLTVLEYAFKLLRNKLLVLTSLTFIILTTAAYYSPGPHQSYLHSIEKEIIWCLYWLGLGVLSSVGLGTGLHTFLLYLGPHIAAVTLAAYECGTINFPSPPYPESIVCPDNEDLSSRIPVTVWSIMSKVRLEAMMWGAGTALGELPPYFMARAARLSSLDTTSRRGGRRKSNDYNDVESLAEFEALQEKKQRPADMSWIDRAKLGVERLVKKVGFFGILACASIPNPLFDLAGITCGHFLVPFWTFFGATLIGKAIIKTHIQQLTVIVAFNENLVRKAVALLSKLPFVGSRLEGPIEQLLKTQKAKLHNKGGQELAEGGSFLASLFEKLVLLMVAYFLVSIVNSLAQSYHQRLHNKKQKQTAFSNKSYRKSQTTVKQA